MRMGIDMRGCGQGEERVFGTLGEDVLWVDRCMG